MQHHHHNTGDIYPLSDFNRKSAEHIKRLKKTGRAEVLTVNGKAAAVVLDPDTYDQLVQDAELSETLKTINQAKAEYEAGLSKSADEVLSELKAKLISCYPDANL